MTVAKYVILVAAIALGFWLATVFPPVTLNQCDSSCQFIGLFVSGALP